MNLIESPTYQYLLKLKEKVVQIACGSIHTLVRTNQHRIFSCGNGSTYALGHKNRETCSSFKQIEYFNGNEGEVTNVGIKTIACGLCHSGCVLDNGTVYLWGITGDIQYSKESMEKFLLKEPTKIVIKNNEGNVSHRRRSTSQDIQSSNVVIEDIKLGE